MPDTTALKHLKDLWDEREAERLAAQPLSLLRYRSNLLGADLRITNFGGGNTSSKIDVPDPFTGAPVRVLAVKGSGGDLGSITDAGFALLYLDKLEQLKARYRGEAFEDEMVEYYPPAAFGQNRVAASIDTPLHAFLPAPHVDHLHPGLGDRAGRISQRQAEARGIQSPVRPADHLGAMAAARLRARAAHRIGGQGQPGCGGIDPRQPRALHVGQPRSASAT